MKTNFETNENNNTKYLTFNYGISGERPAPPSAILNDNTISKDNSVVASYGLDFIKYFKDGNPGKLPMFTSPPEPRGVKRVIKDLSLSADADQSLSIIVMPFMKYPAMYQSGTSISSIPFGNALDCFLTYRVVCARIMFRQQGILEANDGYGTLVDAVVTPPTNSYSFLQENLLNIQTPPYRKVMGVPARDGITVSLLGSPDYSVQWHDSKMITPGASLVINDASGSSIDTMGDCYIPPYTLISHSNGWAYVFEGSDTVITVGPGVDGPFPWAIVKSTNIQLTLQRPEGDCLFIKTAPASQKVFFKMYIDLVVEGQLHQDYTTNMPLVSPEKPFDFRRLRQALENMVPSVTACSSFFITGGVSPNHITPLCINQGNCQVGMSNKQKAYAASESGKGKEKIDDVVTRQHFVRDVLDNVKVMDIKRYQTVGPSPQDSFSEDEAQHNVTIQKCIGKKKRHKFSQAFKLFIDDGNNPVNRRKPVAWAMSEIQKNVNAQIKKGKKIQPSHKIKVNSNVVNTEDLPEQIKRASIFACTPTTKLLTVPSANRLFRGAIEEMPLTNYQYFPVLTDPKDPKKKALPVCMVYRAGATEKLPAYQASVVDPKGTAVDFTLYYSPDDWDNEEDFLANVEYVLSYVYAYSFNNPPTGPYTLRVFSDYKIAGNSYMYAMTACFMGLPSGGYYTGGYTTDENGNAKLTPISKENLMSKVESATPECPLLAALPDETDGAYINIYSGKVPDMENGKLITANTLDMAIVYAATPFSTRAINATPYRRYIQEDSLVVSNLLIDNRRQYILGSNIRDWNKLQQIAEKKDIPIKLIMRSNPDLFSNYWAKKRKFVEADEFYKERADLLKHIWHFTHKGHLFVDRNAFLGHINKYGANQKFLSENEKKRLDAIHALVDTISSEDAKKKMEEAMENADKSSINIRIKINAEEDGENPESRKEWKNKIKSIVEPYVAWLADLDTFMKKHVGTGKKFSQNSDVGSAIAKLGLSNDIRADAEPTQWKGYELFVDFCNKCSPAGPQMLGFLTEFSKHLGEPNPKVKKLEDIYNWLKEHEKEIKKLYPEDKEEEEMTEKKKNNMKRKIKQKKEEEDQKEEEKKEKKVKVKKEEKINEDDLEHIYSDEDDDN